MKINAASRLLAAAPEDREQDWSAAGCFILCLKTGRMLLGQRSAKVDEPLTWCPFAGTTEPGETPEQTAIREIGEETGYKGPMSLAKLPTFKEIPHFQFFNFLAVVPEEFTPVLNWETEKAEWFDLDFWPSPLHPGVTWLLEETCDEDFTQSALKD